MARLAPIPQSEWPPAMLDAVVALRPEVRRHPALQRENRPQAPGTLETFAHHPDLARAFFTFNGHVLWNTTLTTRHRQLVILRTAARHASPYLWAQHFFWGRDAGLSDEEMARVAFGPDAPFFAPLDTALLRAVDELVDDGAISDDTWRSLSTELGSDQVLDVIFTVGCYSMLAWFFETLELEPDPDIPEMLGR
jgi:alkylhydroperoxidase family enzyme